MTMMMLFSHDECQAKAEVRETIEAKLMVFGFVSQEVVSVVVQVCSWNVLDICNVLFEKKVKTNQC